MTAQLALDLERRGPKTRTDYVMEWHRFVAENPEAYATLVHWTRKDIAEGNKPSMHLMFGWLRRLHWIQRGARPYKVSNNWSRPAVDMLIADYPEFADHFERRGGDGPAN